MIDEPKKLAYIDALRGWAILLVVLVHAVMGPTAIESLRLPPSEMSGQILVPTEIIARICAGGVAGVQLFFVVSALSLTLSWRTRHPVDLGGVRDFFLRRFFRVAPMFYFGIGLYLLLFGWKPREYAPDGIDGFDVALTALFLHGWWPPAINSVVPGGWSIADEAMFYLVFPGLMLLARSLTRLIVTTVAAVVACRVVFLFALQHPPEGLSFPQSLWEPMVYLGFQNQAPNFLFGIVAAAVLMKWPGAESQKTQRQWEGMFAVVLFVAMVLLFNFISNPLIAPTTIFSACAAGLCVLLHRSPTSILVNPVMARIGRVSFSMYILHFALLAPVFRLVITVLRMFMETRNDVVIMAVYYPLLVGVTFVAASVTFALIEAPFMALGRRLIARLRGEAGTASSMALQSRGLAD